MTESPGTADVLLAALPFAAHLDIRLPEATPARTIATLGWSPDYCTAGGILHGGALMTLADTAGAVCAHLQLPQGAGTATVESKTNFFRPLASGTARAVARPLHVGRSFVVVQTDVYDDEDRLLGQTTQTQAVRHG
ncbi:PaaI family thioesterase [Streptomyces sp. NPDC050418]|uniref:PaaI family thioesterase n=1 Tax=Streptomyces sp. NPDC050418 TaxID=3365612 RepID=UPI0037A5862A